MTEHQLLSCFALVFGLLIGSFLNVVIARLPLDRSIVSPPSHCPACGSNIRAYDNIPVLSWIWLRGKCRDCKTAISSLYPAVELLCGLLAWLVYMTYIPTDNPATGVNLLAFVIYFGFVAALVAETFIDIRYYIIPDQLSIYLCPFAIGGMAWLNSMGFESALSWQQSVMGAALGGGGLALLAGLWWLIRRYEGMGFGDVKLLALIGAVLGPWPALPLVLIMASLLAVFVGTPIGVLRGRGLKSAMPFGPFLAVASVIWMFHGTSIANYWLPGWDLLF